MKFFLLLSFILLGCLAGFSADGKTISHSRGTEECTVWLFLDPECPISQNYTLTLRKMHEAYADRGVTFRGIYTSPVIKKSEIRDFHKKYQIPFPGEIDKKFALANRWNATVTPEVIVTSPIGEVLYRGAIDNWYYALGKNRPEPTENYLKNALDAILMGKPVSKRTTEAIGCLINR